MYGYYTLATAVKQAEPKRRMKRKAEKFVSSEQLAEEKK
jgi:hypothetical protein